MVRLIVVMAGLLLTVAGVRAQAPPATVTSEQVNKTKGMLADQASYHEAMRRAASCEAQMLDIPTLKARLAQLEALEKKPDAAAPAPPETKPK